MCAAFMSKVPAVTAATDTKTLPPMRITSRESVASKGREADRSDIGVVERRFGEESLFFVVNTSNVARPLTIGLGAPGRKVEWWDPVAERKATLASDANGQITLTLAPYQFFWFRLRRI